jgi:hypothetical protein
MKMKLIGLTLAAVLVSMFAFTGSAFAQAELPPEAPDGAVEPLYLNHDTMLAFLVDLTGLSAEDVTARLTAGETAYDIAISQGVAPEDFQSLMPMSGSGRMGTGEAPRQQMQQKFQYLYQDGACLGDGEPQLLNLNLRDGSAANRGGRWNR